MTEQQWFDFEQIAMDYQFDEKEASKLMHKFMDDLKKEWQEEAVREDFERQKAEIAGKIDDLLKGEGVVDS